MRVIRHSLYGLKQAPRAWCTRLSSHLCDLGFVISKADTTLFVKHTADFTIYLLVYVDDIILTGSPNAPLHDLMQSFQLEFAIKDLGDIHYFLGIEVLHTNDGLHLHQGQFVRKILKNANM